MFFAPRAKTRDSYCYAALLREADASKFVERSSLNIESICNHRAMDGLLAKTQKELNVQVQAV